MNNELSDARRWADAQEREFMRVRIEHFNFGEIMIPDELAGETPIETGWYGRLSAPGYLDCTDWSGPHDDEDSALLDLYAMYGDDFDPSAIEEE